MIGPMIHRLLRRDDLALLVNVIAERSPDSRNDAKESLESGAVDALLDHPAALDAVRGRGGVPAPLPLPLLWYVPIRAALRSRGKHDIAVADYTASVPIAFLRTANLRAVSRGEAGIAMWWDSIERLPHGTVAQAERAALCGALALWWAGCFPDWVQRKGRGPGTLRAYTDFARAALQFSAHFISRQLPEISRVYRRTASEIEIVRDALAEVGSSYLGSEAHTSQGRIRRFLSQISRDFAD
ncbi:MAG: hypothetical protein ACE5FJ_09085 [Gemmatimonadales bacterium]